MAAADSEADENLCVTGPVPTERPCLREHQDETANVKESHLSSDLARGVKSDVRGMSRAYLCPIRREGSSLA